MVTSTEEVVVVVEKNEWCKSCDFPDNGQQIILLMF